MDLPVHGRCHHHCYKALQLAKLYEFVAVEVVWKHPHFHTCPRKIWFLIVILLSNQVIYCVTVLFFRINERDQLVSTHIKICLTFERKFCYRQSYHKATHGNTTHKPYQNRSPERSRRNWSPRMHPIVGPTKAPARRLSEIKPTHRSILPVKKLWMLLSYAYYLSWLQCL